MSNLEEELHKLRQTRTKQLTQNEALDLALEAAELHIKFLRIAKEGQDKTELRSRTSSVLDEAERIRNVETWDDNSQPLINFGVPASQRPAINGTDGTTSSQVGQQDPFLSISRSLAPLNESFSGYAGPNLLDDTDVNDWTHPQERDDFSPVARSPLVPPKSTRVLSRKEQILLLRGSELNGCKFPPWERSPSDSDFDRSEGQELFIDGTEFRLSNDQLEHLADWRRPEHALPPPSWDNGTTETTLGLSFGPTMELTMPADFVQDAATDCSVVASLATGAARALQGHQKLLSTIMFPYDTVRQHPRLSANGRYIIRLNFNGCPRRVIIDDRLPVSRTERTLHVVDRNNPGSLWPALIEKAYLKVRGGYDFPGSNSGTDLWMLCGWIPEQVFLQYEEDLTELWSRILPHSATGDVMVTLGTGAMTDTEEQDTQLAGEHCYAVLQIAERDGRNMLLVKNPWLNAMSWKDPRTTLPNSTAEGVDKDDTVMEDNSNMYTKGTFWMAMDDVYQYFEFMYLNWNPGFFAHRQDIHFIWDLASERSVPGSFAANPQFSLALPGGGPIWLLLQRHFAGRDVKKQHSTDDIADGGMIGLSAFEQSKHRVYLANGAEELAVLVDSPQVLLKLDAPKHAFYTIVPDEEELKPKAYAFTLTAFAEKPITIENAVSRYNNSSQTSGNWTSATAGCTPDSEAFDENPQYSFTLPKSSPVSLLLETKTSHVRVRVILMRGEGERVIEANGKAILADSGRYTGQVAYANMQNLKAGTYTIVCSTYEPSQPANFSLQVESVVEHTVKSVQREDAGRITTRLSDASFAPGVRAVASPMVVNRICRAKFKIEYESPAMDHPLNVIEQHLRSPFRLSVEVGEAPNRSFFMTSGNGQFVNLKKGVTTEDIDLQPPSKRARTMWLVLDRMGGHEASNSPEERIKVKMIADAEDAIQFGVWREHAL